MKKHETRAPTLGEKILKLILPDSEAESISGDYEYIYKDLLKTKGSIYARMWYWMQILKSMFTAISVWFYWSFAMFKNYLKITWRDIKRHKAYSLINISGLALGIACCIFILLWIQDELSWDRFHDNADELFLIAQRQPDGHLTPVTPDALAGHLKTEYPEVIDAARFKYYYTLQLKYEDNSFAEEPILTDPSFFNMFSFDFISGNPDSAFTDPSSIVITDELAQKLFGQEDPIGKTITVNNRSDFGVTGVVENVPTTSTIQFDCVLPFQFIYGGRTDNNWRNSSTWTYIQLQKRISHNEVNQKISGLISERNPENKAALDLRPLTQLHLRPQGSGGPIIYVYIFSAMAIFILIIACINFINLTTARSANRAREVGLRKVVGAKRTNLIKQFFGESILFSLVSVIFAVVLVSLLLTQFNNLADKQFSIVQDIALNLNLILGILGIVLVTGILSGIYPAFLLSSFQPAKVLRTSKNMGINGRSPLLRRILVVLQFSLSIFLMIGTFVIYKQLNFIKNRDLGFDKSLIVCSDSSWGSLDRHTIRNELQSNPNVLNVTFSNQKMGDWESGARDDVNWEGKTDQRNLTFEVIFCDHDFLETHKMEMIEGRFFSREIQSDTRSAFILNESAVKVMEFGDESPVGKSLSFWDEYQGSIIGVIKDFHTQSLHNEIQPVIMAHNPGSLDNISIRLSSSDISGTLRFLEEKWKEMTAGFNFEYSFLNESLNRRYRAEQATGTLLGYFTFLAIFISCIGLLGLIAFVAQQRTKEVGIRKVLGASVASIVRLLVKEFVLLVLLANIIAWPLAYLVLKQWLENFAYRTDVGILAFVLAGSIALIIALLTASLQALKTATTNPIDSLHYE